MWVRCFWSLLAFTGFNYWTSNSSQPPKHIAYDFKYTCHYETVWHRFNVFCVKCEILELLPLLEQRMRSFFGRLLSFEGAGSPCSDLMSPLSFALPPIRGDPGCQQGETRHNILLQISQISYKSHTNLTQISKISHKSHKNLTNLTQISQISY